MRAHDRSTVRSVAIASVGALLAAPGCTNTTYEVQVRDPARVAVTQGDKTLVPEGGPLPARVVVERSGERYRAYRTGDGALWMERASGWALRGPTWEALVDREGRITSLSWGPGPEPKPEIRWWAADPVRAPLCHSGGKHGCTVPLSVVTPRDNVRAVTRVVTPMRVPGVFPAVVGVGLGVVGAAALVGWARDKPPPANGWVPGAVLLTGSAASLAVAGWFLFAPPRREVLIAPSP